MDNRPIGIFDSGMGGISVLAEALKVLKNESFVYFGDNLYAPYGTKPSDKIYERANYIVNFLIQKNVKAILIACNTASSVAAEKIRMEYHLPIVAMEPALKPAALEFPGKDIAVLATELTLKLEKFKRLMNKYGSNAVPIACPKIVEYVESLDQDEDKLIEYLKSLIDKNKYSAIVLGCTHFVFVKDIIADLYSGAKIFDGNLGTAKQLAKILKNKDLLSDGRNAQKVEFYSSSNDPLTLKLMQNLLEKAKLIAKK